MSPYIEDWFQSIAKDVDFYASLAEPDDNKLQRCYFYNVDLQGRLFLEETFPKNIATSIKDERFLNFFFRRVRTVDESLQKSVMEPRDIPVHDYPFVSPCGKELNFIRPAACPFVFHGLVSATEDDKGSDEAQQQQHLLYGGSLRQVFAWHDLAVSRVTGRMYHTKGETANLSYGLVRSQLAVSLVEQMEILSARDDNNNEEALAFRDADGRLQSVPWLPADAEPGSWAMPWECEQ